MQIDIVVKLNVNRIVPLRDFLLKKRLLLTNQESLVLSAKMTYKSLIICKRKVLDIQDLQISRDDGAFGSPLSSKTSASLMIVSLVA